MGNPLAKSCLERLERNHQHVKYSILYVLISSTITKFPWGSGKSRFYKEHAAYTRHWAGPAFVTGGVPGGEVGVGGGMCSPLLTALTSNHAFSGAIGIERDVELTVKLLKAQGHEVVTVVATEHLHCR